MNAERVRFAGWGWGAPPTISSLLTPRGIVNRNKILLLHFFKLYTKCQDFAQLDLGRRDEPWFLLGTYFVDRDRYRRDEGGILR